MGTGDQGIEERIRATFESSDLARAATLTIEGYGPEVLGFLAARLPTIADANEVFSMFCEDLWTGLPRFRWLCTMRGYCYTLARNAANRYMVAPANRADRRASLSELSLSQAIDRVRSQSAAYLRTEVKSRMRQLREQLPEEDQTLLILRVERQLPWRELAVVMSQDATPLDDAAIEQASVRLRKRFQLATQKLKELARRDGLLGD